MLIQMPIYNHHQSTTRTYIIDHHFTLDTLNFVYSRLAESNTFITFFYGLYASNPLFQAQLLAYLYIYGTFCQPQLTCTLLFMSSIVSFYLNALIFSLPYTLIYQLSRFFTVLAVNLFFSSMAISAINKKIKRTKEMMEMMEMTYDCFQLLAASQAIKYPPNKIRHSNYRPVQIQRLGFVLDLVKRISQMMVKAIMKKRRVQVNLQGRMTNTGKSNLLRKVRFINSLLPKQGRRFMLQLTIRNTVIPPYRIIRNCRPEVRVENLMPAQIIRKLSCIIMSKKVLTATRKVSI